MAGSFNHMVGDDGRLTFSLLEGGDYIEALEDCWNLIVELTHGDRKKIDRAGKRLVGPNKVYRGVYVERSRGPNKVFHTRYEEAYPAGAFGSPRGFRRVDP